MLQLKQQLLDRIEEDQQHVIDIDSVLSSIKQKEREDLERIEAAKLEADIELLKSRSKIKVSTTLSFEDWVSKWKPHFLYKLKNGGLHDLEYESIFVRMKITTKEEANSWIKS